MSEDSRLPILISAIAALIVLVCGTAASAWTLYSGHRTFTEQLLIARLDDAHRRHVSWLLADEGQSLGSCGNTENTEEDAPPLFHFRENFTVLPGLPNIDPTIHGIVIPCPSEDWYTRAIVVAENENVELPDADDIPRVDPKVCSETMERLFVHGGKMAFLRDGCPLETTDLPTHQAVADSRTLFLIPADMPRALLAPFMHNLVAISLLFFLGTIFAVLFASYSWHVQRVALLAHRIRNRLSTVNLTLEVEGYFKERRRKEKYTELMRPVVSDIERAVDRARNPFRGLFTSGTSEITKELLCSVWEASGELITKGDEVEVSIDGEEELSVLVDEEDVRRILEPIVHNARIWCNVMCWITVRDESDWVVMVVEDDGPGIPDDDLDKVFRKGWTRRKDGSGLGLFDAKNVAQEVRGFVRARGSERARGAQFEVFLPKGGRVGTLRQNKAGRMSRKLTR